MPKVCSGCGACIAVCPRSCLELVFNEEGFLEASDKGDSCVGCGLCDKVCPFQVTLSVSDVVESGYYISPCPEMRLQSSSGGVCGTISSHFIQGGISVVGATYDSGVDAVRHQVARNAQELEAFKGSKYLQSDPAAIYKTMDNGDCLVIGTPCQIAGARHYARIKRLPGKYAYIDFYCHGVPTAYLWSKYLKENRIEDIKSINFRDKAVYGWNDWTLHIEHAKGTYRSAYLHDGDFFTPHF